MTEGFRPRVYVSGPMTGLPYFNFPAFDAVTELLNAADCVVFSPADNDRRRLAEVGIDDVTQVHGFAEGNVQWYNAAVDIRTEELFRDDFNFIVNEATHLVLLPGWEASTGARYELVVAEALAVAIVLAVQDDEGAWSLVDFDDEKPVTEYLRSFRQAIPEPIEDVKPEFSIDVPPIDNYSVRELLTEVRKRVGHSPTIAHSIAHIEANLA